MRRFIWHASLTFLEDTLADLEGLLRTARQGEGPGRVADGIRWVQCGRIRLRMLMRACEAGPGHPPAAYRPHRREAAARRPRWRIDRKLSSRGT